MFYSESTWDPKHGKDIIRIYKKGYVSNIATFYDKKIADEVIIYLNKKEGTNAS